MSDDEDEKEAVLEVFDVSEASIKYTRSKDTKEVVIRMRDPNGISEMKTYLLLCLECEKLEARLGISETHEAVQ